MRRLHVTKAGYWYILLTIAIGVVALASGNNVLYLMECMLLGGMILSGVVSEKTIASIDARLLPRQAVAAARTQDELEIINRSRLPFFCVEVLEWRGGDFSRLAFLPKVPPGGETRVGVPRLFAARGAYDWQGLGVATAGPFGFARKIRIDPGPGHRIVWPAQDFASGAGAETLPATARGMSDASSEIRQFVPTDDARSIVWKLSAKGIDPVVRARSDERPEIILTLDLRVEPGEEFEKRLRELAGAIYRAGRAPDLRVVLVVRSRASRREIRGRRPTLDFLAIVQAEGRA